jgi:hypothetical protein
MEMDAEAIRDRYEVAGWSITWLAGRYEVSRPTFRRFMVEHGIPIRPVPKRPPGPKGDKHHAWKGDKAGRVAMHYRVRSVLGKPNRCGQCGTREAGLVYDWANLTGDYTKISDYQRMCRSCHVNYDRGVPTMPIGKRGWFVWAVERKRRLRLQGRGL